MRALGVSRRCKGDHVRCFAVEAEAVIGIHGKRFGGTGQIVIFAVTVLVKVLVHIFPFYSRPTGTLIIP